MSGAIAAAIRVRPFRWMRCWHDRLVDPSVQGNPARSVALPRRLADRAAVRVRAFAGGDSRSAARTGRAALRWAARDGDDAARGICRLGTARAVGGGRADVLLDGTRMKQPAAEPVAVSSRRLRVAPHDDREIAAPSIWFARLGRASAPRRQLARVGSGHGHAAGGPGRENPVGGLLRPP